MRWRWILVPVPTVIGLAIGLWFDWNEQSNPVLYLRADLGTMIFISSVGISLLMDIGLAILDWVERDRLDMIIDAAENRRHFLRRLDHELKNPLTAILAGLANLSAADTNATRQTALRSVDTQVQRLRRLVGELRKLSDLETRPLERSPVDMTELLEDTFEIAQDHHGVSDRRLTLSIPRAPWSLPTISGDRDLLILSLHNLLDNAIKFTHPGDTVEMSAFEDGNSVVVEVADTGPGIPDEEVPHVWEELYRGEGARGIPGSGLGLALVRAIVARHDGQINLRSRPQQGTVITMRLPIGG